MSVTHQEVFSSESSSHELANPLVLVEVFTGWVGDVVISGLYGALTDEQTRVAER